MPEASFLSFETAKPYSRRQVEFIANWIGEDKKRFSELVDLFLKEEKSTTQLAAGVLSRVSMQHPALVQPHLKKLVNNLQKPVSTAVKRNTVRLLQHLNIPKELQGAVADTCFQYLQDPQEAIAVRAFSITVLANICAAEPELKREFLLILEEQLPFSGAGFRVRARMAIKALGLG